MKIVDCEQGSSSWYQARIGLVTASEMDALVTPSFKAREGVGVETYLCKKLSEKLLGWSQDELNGGSWATEQGQLVERIALPWYNFTYDANAKRVGFCAHDTLRVGCSPDAIGDDEGLEIKSPQPTAQTRYLLRGEVPPEYRVQIHASMLVTGFSRWSFCAFSRQLPKLVIRVERDDKIQAALHEILESFFARFDAAYAKLKKMQDDETPKMETAEAKTWGGGRA